jgi:hypothetical protein
MESKKQVFPACKRQIIHANWVKNRAHYRKFTSKRRIHGNIKFSRIQTAEILLANKNGWKSNSRFTLVLPAKTKLGETVGTQEKTARLSQMLASEIGLRTFTSVRGEGFHPKIRRRLKNIFPGWQVFKVRFEMKPL